MILTIPQLPRFKERQRRHRPSKWARQTASHQRVLLAIAWMLRAEVCESDIDVPLLPQGVPQARDAGYGRGSGGRGALEGGGHADRTIRVGPQLAGGPAAIRASNSSSEPREPKIASSHQVAPASA